MFIMKLFFITFLITFTFIKSEINIVDLTFKNEILTLDNLNQSVYYFHLSFNQNLNIPNYIQILIDIYYKNIKYLISYYDNDSTFINRKQFSQTSTSKAFLWLNKEQIKNGFYFKVEAKNYETIKLFKLEINPKNYIELNLFDSTYNYYVTEKNKYLKFLIDCVNEKENNNINNRQIIIWAYGNNKIETYLNISNFEKHSKYNAYIIKQNEQNEYILSVNAEENDIINVGFINLVKDDLYNVCTNCNNILSIYKGFLKKNILENICFPDNFELNIFHIKYLDIKIDINRNYTGKYECILLPNKIEELFFSFHYLNDISYSIQNSYSNYGSYKYHYLLKGIYYLEVIDNKIGFLPLRIEEDFEYLIYYVISPYPNRKFNIYFSLCEDYPFCSKITKEFQNNNIAINQYLNTYTIILSKKQFQQFNFDFPSNQRLLLFIRCLEEKYPCKFYINIYSDKTKIYQGTENKYMSYLSNYENHKEPNIQHKYIRKKMIDNILIKPKNDLGFYISPYYINSFINVEKINGDIMINNNKKLINSINNIYNYKLDSLDDYIDLKIKANKDSLYNIKYYHFLYLDNVKNYFIRLGGNTLIDLENNKNVNIRYYDRIYEDWNNILTNIYPINCEIDVQSNGIEKYELKAYHIDNITFFQNLSMLYYGYCITQKNNRNNNNSCMIQVSSYSLNVFDENNLNNLENTIILSDNIPYIYVFNNKFNELIYSYYFINNTAENINININLLNKGDFIIKININNNIFYKEINIKSDEKIIINKEEFEQKHSLNNEIFRLYIKIINNNDNNEDSFLKILINTENNDKNNDKINDKNNDKNISVIFIYIFIFILIILILGLIIIYKRKKPNNKVNEKEIREKELKEIINI